MKPVSLAVAMLATVAAGYYLRFHAPLPPVVRDSSGGAAYVVCFALLGAFVLPLRRAVTAAMLFTIGVEFLQLWHPPPLERLRATLPGRLLLGTTFNWGDFPPYFVGGLLGWMILRALSPSGTKRAGQGRR